MAENITVQSSVFWNVILYSLVNVSTVLEEIPRLIFRVAS